jgi:hypothetical protein
VGAHRRRCNAPNEHDSKQGGHVWNPGACGHFATLLQRAPPSTAQRSTAFRFRCKSLCMGPACRALLSLDRGCDIFRVPDAWSITPLRRVLACADA